MVLVFFAYFALASIAAGVLTVALRHPVHCGLALLALLVHVSGLFILLNAEFLWAVQIIVYAGAILVLYHLRQIQQHETFPLLIRQAVMRLSTKITQRDTAPFSSDPIADARLIIDHLNSTYRNRARHAYE